MLFFYDIFLFFYALGVRLAALWNPKARQWVTGRKGIFERLKEAVGKENGPIIWMHCASLGEFEQGRPVLEKLRTTYPTRRILLTFFSPSGYEVRKGYAGADMVFYLPLDGRVHSKKFLDIVRPTLAVFVKYESWFHYLNALKRRKIPTLLISAIFTPKQHFFGLLGGFLRSMLEHYTHIFVQDKSSADLLKKFGLNVPVSIAGDTRFDRVVAVANQPFQHTTIEYFCSMYKVVVAGSTWREDEEMLEALLVAIPELKLIIAPHEIDEKHLQSIRKQFNNIILLSEAVDLKTLDNARVLVIDCVGMLSKIYRFATLCYVGGGFNTAGIHNILEAAANGKTVIFGPNHDRTSEAATLITAGAGFSYSDKGELIAVAQKLIDDVSYRTSKEKTAYSMVAERKGATDTILHHIAENRLLSNS